MRRPSIAAAALQAWTAESARNASPPFIGCCGASPSPCPYSLLPFGLPLAPRPSPLCAPIFSAFAILSSQACSCAPQPHQVSRGFEPRSLDSESRVLTVTPRDHLGVKDFVFGKLTTHWRICGVCSEGQLWAHMLFQALSWSKSGPEQRRHEKKSSAASPET